MKKKIVDLRFYLLLVASWATLLVIASSKGFDWSGEYFGLILVSLVVGLFTNILYLSYIGEIKNPFDNTEKSIYIGVYSVSLIITTVPLGIFLGALS